jgi:hypothetical protein
MAYSRNFNSESDGAAANYSAGDLNASTTLTIQSGVAFGGSGKALEVKSNNVNIQHDWAYDSASNFSSGDFTATFVARMSITNNGSACRVGCMFRVDSGANNGYCIQLRPQAASATVRLCRFSGATETVITTANYDAGATFVVDTWYHVKVYMNGSTIRVRVWKDGDAEPGTWLIDTTDATYDNTRVKTGVYTFSSITSGDPIVYVDEITEESASTAIKDIIGMGIIPFAR